MSLWSRAPRQVYEVHGEDDYVAENTASPSECAVRGLDANAEGSRWGRLLGLALLAVVTLGAVALVLLHISHAPAVRQSVAERPASSHARRRAFPQVPNTAPPKVHVPRYSTRHAPPSTLPAARPGRRRRRIAGGHAEPPKTLAAGQVGGQPPSAPARAVGEFEFER